MNSETQFALCKATLGVTKLQLVVMVQRSAEMEASVKTHWKPTTKKQKTGTKIGYLPNHAVIQSTESSLKCVVRSTSDVKMIWTHL